MAWGAIAASVIGGMMASDAAGSAANKQAGAAGAATAAQERMFNKQVELQAPFRQGGLAANNRLMYLLGLGGIDPGIQGTTNYDTLRQQLLPRFTTTTQENGVVPFMTEEGMMALRPGATSRQSINESALDAEIRRLQQENQAKIDAATASAKTDPEFGSLMRRFGMADFEADPGYAFRQSEGMKGVENSAAARGGLLSGAALKAIQKYGQDLASQEYGNAYQRFNADQTNKYNRLAGIVNTGQGATNQVSNAASQFGQQQGSNIMAAGNAQAAGIVGSANALNSSIGQGVNLYQQNQLMDLIRNPGATRTTSTRGYTVPTYDGAEY